MVVFSILQRHALAWILIVGSLWPVPFRQSPQFLDAHRVSFCVGPALYRYGDGLVPALDLFSQYGVGQGFFFAPFLAATVRRTIENFFVLHFAVVLAFFLMGYHFLSWLLRSRGWALGVCLTSVVGQFYGSGGQTRFSITPSVSAYRAPLLIVTAAIMVWLFRRRSPMAPALLLGGCLGLSIFWQTDTGLATLVAALAGIVLLRRPVGQALRVALLAGTMAGVTFFAFGRLAYGPNFLSLAFVQHLFAPWLWYVGGDLTLNGFPWDFDNGLPVVLLALLGCLTLLGQFTATYHDSRHRLPPRGAGLAFLACVGLLLHAKYAVRPIFGYWAGASLPSLAVVAWLVKNRLPRLCRSLPMGPRLASRLAAFIALVGAAWVTAGVWDTTEQAFGELVYGWRAISGYNGIPKAVLQTAVEWVGAPPRRDPPSANAMPEVAGTPKKHRMQGITKADRELIRSNTEEGERVAIISAIDWAFLLEAKRPPRYYILPVHLTPPSGLADVIRATREARLVFVEVGSAFDVELDPSFHDEFEPMATSDNLILYRPRTRR